MLLQINQELSHWVYSGINDIFFLDIKLTKKKNNYVNRYEKYSIQTL